MLRLKNRCSTCGSQYPNILTNHEMLGAEVNNERTILDYLNEHCLEAILDYVPMREIILSEPVSRRWQQMVLTYLKKQRININMAPVCLYDIDPPANVRSVTLWINGPLMQNDGLPEIIKTFKLWLQKMSPAVVAAWCNSKRMYEAVSGHCRNLESLTLVNVKDKLPVKENINRVRRLSFMQCTLSTKCMNQFTKNNAVLEELSVYRSHDLHGQYLSNMKSKRLKTLIFSECTGLMANSLISAPSVLNGLTKFVLHNVPRAVYDKVHILLDNMPCLEHFAMRIEFCDTKTQKEKNLEYIGAVCRLSRLERLDLAYDATDEDVEAVTRHCTKLRHLRIPNCYKVTGRGIAALCRNAGARLEVLDVTQCYNLQDDDVVAVVKHCPNLTSLNLRLVGQVTGALLWRAEDARRAQRARRRLRLHLGYTNLWLSERLPLSARKYTDELIMQH